MSVGSLFLALVGISEILLSLIVAWFFCRVILHIKYFGGLNLLCLLIVCAVGADVLYQLRFGPRQRGSKFTLIKPIPCLPALFIWLPRCVYKP